MEDRFGPEDWAELILPVHALHAQEVRFEWRGGERQYAATPEP